MNVIHLPGAIVGDPRCNCVMCERNRQNYIDRMAKDCPDCGSRTLAQVGSGRGGYVRYCPRCKQNYSAALLTPLP